MAELAAAEATEVERQMGTRPKEHVPWPSTQEFHRCGDGSGDGFVVPMHQEPEKWPSSQELYQAEEELAGYPMLQKHQIASAWAERTTIFEWRAARPIDLSKSQEWGTQPLLRSQILEGLPERFGQLGIISLVQHNETGQAIMVLPQSTFTFPIQGNVTTQNGASPLFHSA